MGQGLWKAMRSYWEKQTRNKLSNTHAKLCGRKRRRSSYQSHSSSQLTTDAVWAIISAPWSVLCYRSQRSVHCEHFSHSPNISSNLNISMGKMLVNSPIPVPVWWNANDFVMLPRGPPCKKLLDYVHSNNHTATPVMQFQCRCILFFF